MLNAKQMAAKQYLQQIYRCNEMIKENLAEMEYLRDLSTSIPSPNLTEERVSKSPSIEPRFVNAIAKLADLERIADQKIAELFDLRIEIRNTISLVKDANRILILRYRYMDSMKWEDIAEKMDYSLKSVNRIHSLALSDVADILTAKGKVA